MKLHAGHIIGISLSPKEVFSLQLIGHMWPRIDRMCPYQKLYAYLRHDAVCVCVIYFLTPLHALQV